MGPGMSEHNKNRPSRTDQIDAGHPGATGARPSVSPLPCGDRPAERQPDQPGATVSDAELLDRWRSGEESALEMLLSRYERPVYLFVLGLLRDPHRAEDVLQETFYTALTRLDGVDREHFRGWLFTVAYHQAMLERRRQALHKRFGSGGPDIEELPCPANTPEPWQQVQRQEQLAQLERWVTQLPPGLQQVLRLRIFEGLRFREIAARLGCPLGTALARWHQALKRLLRLAEDSSAGADS